MRKPRKSKSEIQREIGRLQEQLKSAEIAEEAEFGRLARRAGVFDLDLDEEKMRDGLTLFVERFHGGSKDRDRQAPVASNPDQGGGQTPGA